MTRPELVRPMSAAELKAYSEGFRRAMNGYDITPNPFQGQLCKAAYERGWREYQDRIRQIKK